MVTKWKDIKYLPEDFNNLTEIALARVQRVHEPVDLWDITFCTHRFWGF